jgi:hypothetical protein
VRLQSPQLVRIASQDGKPDLTLAEAKQIVASVGLIASKPDPDDKTFVDGATKAIQFRHPSQPTTAFWRFSPPTIPKIRAFS